MKRGGPGKGQGRKSSGNIRMEIRIKPWQKEKVLEFLEKLKEETPAK